MLTRRSVGLWPLIAHGRILALRSLGIVLLLWGSPAQAALETPSIPRSSEPHHQSSLAYVSDFFFFVGKDASGHITFALDNNRGRDGDAWQTEHLLMLLHDEQNGWQELKGTGPFDNTQQKLSQIPNSPYFEFIGKTTTGLTINNLQRHLTLEVGPITRHLERKDGDSLYQMGSSSGTIEWQGRTLTGRVIHEHLELTDFNRLTRQYLDLWTESYGLYAWIEDSQDLLYFHQQADETRLTPLVGNLVGFGVLNHDSEHLRHLKLRISDSTQAWGLYQWPAGWNAQWTGKQGRGSMSIQISDLQVVANFFLGGLAMGIIKGEITYNGTSRPVYGIAELLL